MSKWMIGVGALALGMLCYKAFEYLRFAKVSRDDGERLETWEGEGGTVPDA